MAQSSDMAFCPFFSVPTESVNQIRATKENIQKIFTTKSPERRKELHDSKEDGKGEQGKVIEAEKNEDTDNETIPWERADEVVAELLKEEEMEEERRKNK